MIVAICGSRSITDKIFIYNALDMSLVYHDAPIVVIVGDASGVDTIVHEWAIEHKYDVIVLKSANKHYNRLYSKLGREGNLLYLARDMDVVDNCDFLIAIWDKKSTGTKFTIDYAKKIGKPVVIVERMG